MGGQGVQQVSRPMQARQHHPGFPLPRKLPGGLSISRTSNKPSSAAAAVGRIGGASVLSTGEVVGPGAMAAMGPDSGLTPCTPYCPGVTGFPGMYIHFKLFSLCSYFSRLMAISCTVVQCTQY